MNTHRPNRTAGLLGRLPPYVYYLSAGTTLVFGASYYVFLDQVPLTQRRRWIATSPAFEQRAGDEEYAKLRRQFHTQILPRTHRATATVHRVGDRLSQAAAHFAQQHHISSPNSSQPYTYTVVRNDMANAFVLPGNHVFVMTGLFQYVQSEDDLAAVLGHEMAHNVARHAGEKVSSSLVVNLLARLSLLLDPSGVLLGVLLPAATVLRELPHSRVQETEADQIGLHLAARACYDPAAAKRVFANMQSAEGAASPPEFLSTHPTHKTRIQNFDQWLPAARDEFRSNPHCQTIRRDMQLARQAAAWEATVREGQRTTSSKRH